MIWLFPHKGLLRSWHLFRYVLGSSVMPCFWVGCILKMFSFTYFSFRECIFCSWISWKRKPNVWWGGHIPLFTVPSLKPIGQLYLQSMLWRTQPGALVRLAQSIISAQHIMPTETCFAIDKVGKYFNFKFYYLSFHL